MEYRELCLEFNKIRLKISTNYKSYYDYLNLYFRGIISKDPRDEFCIYTEARWQKEDFKDYITGLKASADIAMIGANTFAGKDRVVSVKKIAKKTKILFDFIEEREKIHTKLLLRRKPFKDFLKYKVGGKAEEELFFEITYPVVYYPLFWYKEVFYNTHMLHASAIETNNKCIVICGLEGMGKTSMSLSLLDKSGHFLSDNIIFYDKESIYPCYELIRLNKKDSVSLWKNKIKRINGFKTPKDFYRMDLDLAKEAARPDIFIFPKFSSGFSAKELDKTEAVNKAIVLSQLPAELNNYGEYSNLYRLTRPKLDIWKQRYASLENLLEDIRCFEIGMDKSEGLERNSERLRGFIKGV